MEKLFKSIAMTEIEWTDRTWNPVTGCNKVSQGCKNCYAEIMHKRQMAMNPHKYTKPFLAGAEIHEEELRKPLAWTKPCRVFVNSMSDLFHEDVPFIFIDTVFATMAICPNITFQILTKRPERMLEWSKQYDGPVFPLPNVWLGVSCEDQATADERIPLLIQVPAAVRFLSCEPLLGHINFLDCIKWIKPEHGPHQYPKIGWVITGGESGHHARPMHPEWVRSIRDQCQVANVPFFFKQWGEFFPVEHSMLIPEKHRTKMPSAQWTDFIKYGKKVTGHLLDGKEYFQFPKSNG